MVKIGSTTNKYPWVRKLNINIESYIEVQIIVQRIKKK